ncbi:MAG: phytanoyl-CoA dioxygenase family protein [Moorea sp. SIO4A3]|nr:phytanoyl-CoA dioxygenase family protein [Moorena sp. SIO4A3]
MSWNTVNIIPTPKILNNLSKKGYFFIENAVDLKVANQLLQEVNIDNLSVNKNEIGGVYSGNQKFLSNCLTRSKIAYDLITSPKVLDICSSYLPARYQLISHQFAQTRRGLNMLWHTDNNQQLDSKVLVKHQMPGLIFIIYLSEQNISPFQYIEGSHLWSSKYDSERYISDAWVQKHYRKDIRTFEMKKGDLIIFDLHGFHRARPFQDRNHVRNIFQFQVEQINENYLGHGEQNLVNVGFIDNPSPDILNYLGFGIPRKYPILPKTSIVTMSMPELISLYKQLFYPTLKAMITNLGKALIPREWQLTLKDRLGSSK